MQFRMFKIQRTYFLLFIIGMNLMACDSSRRKLKTTGAVGPKVEHKGPDLSKNPNGEGRNEDDPTSRGINPDSPEAGPNGTNDTNRGNLGGNIDEDLPLNEGISDGQRREGHMGAEPVVQQRVKSLPPNCRGQLTFSGQDYTVELPSTTQKIIEEGSVNKLNLLSSNANAPREYSVQLLLPEITASSGDGFDMRTPISGSNGKKYRLVLSQSKNNESFQKKMEVHFLTRSNSNIEIEYHQGSQLSLKVECLGRSSQKSGSRGTSIGTSSLTVQCFGSQKSSGEAAMISGQIKSSFAVRGHSSQDINLPNDSQLIPIRIGNGSIPNHNLEAQVLGLRSQIVKTMVKMGKSDSEIVKVVSTLGTMPYVILQQKEGDSLSLGCDRSDLLDSNSLNNLTGISP